MHSVYILNNFESSKFRPITINFSSLDIDILLDILALTEVFFPANLTEAYDGMRPSSEYN